jgi:hypothetical protein
MVKKTDKKRNCITHTSIWDDLDDICVFLHIAPNRLNFLFDVFLMNLCPRSTYRVSIDKEHNCINFTSIWDDLGDICVFLQNMAFVSLFDFNLHLIQIQRLWSQSVAHTV